MNKHWVNGVRDADKILEPISSYVGDLSEHELKYLLPRVDFFKKHESQLISSDGE